MLDAANHQEKKKHSGSDTVTIWHKSLAMTRLKFCWHRNVLYRLWTDKGGRSLWVIRAIGWLNSLQNKVQGPWELAFQI